MESTRTPEQAFKSPEEELRFLRERVAEKEQELSQRGTEVVPGHAARETIAEYKQMSTEKVLHPSMMVSESQLGRYHVELSPEPHDAQVSQLAAMVAEKGIKNALAVLERIQSPH